MVNINKSLLLKKLSQEQRNTVQACMSFSKKLWSTDRIIQYYTDHGPEHSLRILTYIEQMPNIVEDEFLDQDEIYILILSIILHDVGMQCDIRVMDQIRRKAEEDFSVSFIEDYSKTQILTDKHQQEIRKAHSSLTAAWIRRAKMPDENGTLSQALASLPNVYCDDLADICRYHSFYNIQECPKNFKSYLKKRKRFLAALLRLGDELDIDYRRVVDASLENIAFPDENLVHFLLHEKTVINIHENSINTFYNLHKNDIDIYSNTLNTLHKCFCQKNNDVINILITYGCSIYFSVPVFNIEDSAKRLPSKLFENGIKDKKDIDLAQNPNKSNISTFNEKSDNVLSQSYNISTAIKNNTLRMITLKREHEQKLPLRNLIDEFSNFKVSSRWKDAIHLFDMSASIIDVSDVKDKHKISNPSNVFTWLNEKIVESNKNIPVIIKGEPTLGKSSFASLFYVYLIDKYFHVGLSYLPFYFNNDVALKIDNIASDNRAVKKFFDDAEKICSESNTSALFIIDGLTNSKAFDDAVEHFCWDKTNQYTSNVGNEKAHKFIYVVDDYLEIANQLNDVGTRESVDFIIYINQISTVNDFIEDDRAESFINAYSQLFQYEEDAYNRALGNYRRLKLSYINFNIFSIFENQLFSNSVSSITSLYNEYFEEKITDYEKRKKLIKKAYKIFTDENLEYTMYRNYISQKDFKLLIEQHGLLQYLVAKQYVNIIEEGEATEDILKLLFDKQIATFAIDLLEKLDNRSELVKRIEFLYEKVSFEGKSSLSYLTGRLFDKLDAKRLLDKQQLILDKRKNELIDGKELDYFTIAQRSVSISKIALKGACYDEIKKAIFDYLKLLFDDSYHCLINRAFHRLYYGDMTKKVFEAHYDAVKPGFDFRNTFHTLARKLQADLIDCVNEERDPFLEINLFTVCNLFQIRIEKPWVQIIKGKYKTEFESTNYAKTRKTFLYDAKYTKQADFIFEVSKWIDCYLQNYKLNCDNIEYQAFISYLKIMKNHINDYSNHRYDDNYIGANLLYNSFDNLHSLFDVRRIGWNISRNIPINKQAHNEILNNNELVYETTSEHILSAYWIGMFFLPDNHLHGKFTSDPNYDKQEILNVLLLHDIGEATTGDFSPLYENYVEEKIKEDEIMSLIFSLGTFDSLGSTFRNFTLWKQWFLENSGGNINVTIAKDIDKIQMIYKFVSMRDKDINNPYFDRDRINSFIKLREDIKTETGRMIFQHLIENHPKYAKHFKQVELRNSNTSPVLKLKAITFNPKTAEFLGKGYGNDYLEINDTLFKMINENPYSMTIQIIDDRTMLFINLCKKATKKQAIKFAKNIASFHISIDSSVPVVKIGIDDAYSIKSSGDDCYQIDNLNVMVNCDGVNELTIPIAYAYLIDGDAPSLNCERLKELSKDPNCEEREINILEEPERASDVISFSSAAYLYTVVVKDDVNEDCFKYTVALSKNDDGSLNVNHNDYFSDHEDFYTLSAEQNRICGKEVSWKAQKAFLQRNTIYNE